MIGRPDDQPDRRLRFLQGQLEDHAQIAEDIVEIATHTWAIHGSIAVDGEVIMAEFDTPVRSEDGPATALRVRAPSPGFVSMLEGVQRRPS